MTMITNYMITCLACWFGTRLLIAQYSKKQLCRRSWGIGFIFIGVGTLLAGVKHGFGAYLSQTSSGLFWKGALYTTGLSVFFMFAGTVKGSVPELKWRKPLHLYNAAALAAYAIVMINNDSFLFVILDYVPAMLLIFVVQVWSLVKHKSTSAKWFIAGVVVSFIGAGVQVSGFDLHPHFNHNDLYHVIQMLGLFLFYKGARNLNDYGRSEISAEML